MIITWAKNRGIQITTIFRFLSFTGVFIQSKAHLSGVTDRECTFQVQKSNSLSILAQAFLRMNAGSWVNLTILILLNIRISYEWLFQNLRMKYVSKSVIWNLSDGRNAHEQSSFINPSNSAFQSKYIIEIVLEKCLKSIKRALVIYLQAFVYLKIKIDCTFSKFTNLNVNVANRRPWKYADLYADFCVCVKRITLCNCVCSSSSFSSSRDSASVIRNIREFGAKNYFTDHRRANTMHGFTAAVPVL